MENQNMNRTSKCISCETHKYNVRPSWICNKCYDHVKLNWYNLLPELFNVYMENLESYEDD